MKFGELEYESIFNGPNDIPFDVFVSYLLSKQYFYPFNQSLLTRKVNDNKSVLYQCSLKWMLSSTAEIDIFIKVPFIKYPEGYISESNTLIHTNNEAYYVRSTDGQSILEVRPAVVEKARIWFEQICKSVADQDDLGKEKCSYKTIKQKIISGRIKKADIYKVYQFNEMDYGNLGLSPKAICGILSVSKKEIYHVADPNSVFQYCSFFLSSSMLNHELKIDLWILIG